MKATGMPIETLKGKLKKKEMLNWMVRLTLIQILKEKLKKMERQMLIQKTKEKQMLTERLKVITMLKVK